MTTLVNSAAMADAGSAFARYLSDPGKTLAIELAETLSAIAEIDIAQLLLDFSEKGAYRAGVDWWHRGTSCWVDLDPPHPAAVGEMWFDPIELSLSILEPAPARNLDPLGWLSVHPVKPWQLDAVHQLTEHLTPSETFGPVTANYTEVSGCDMHWYVAAFGKREPTYLSWQLLQSGYGAELTRKLWGEFPEQFGGRGHISGVVEVLTLEEVESWADVDAADVWPREVSELQRLGLPFRSGTRLEGAGRWEGTLPRSWA